MKTAAGSQSDPTLRLILFFFLDMDPGIPLPLFSFHIVEKRKYRSEDLAQGRRAAV